MFVGKVIGTVWSTVKWPELGGHKLLLVRPYHLADLIAKKDTASTAPGDAAPRLPRETVVCVDLLDAGVGDDVVIAFGHAARVAAQAPYAVHPAAGLEAAAAQAQADSPTTSTPIDAAVVAILDGYELELHTRANS